MVHAIPLNTKWFMSCACQQLSFISVSLLQVLCCYAHYSESLASPQHWESSHPAVHSSGDLMNASPLPGQVSEAELSADVTSASEL